MGFHLVVKHAFGRYPVGHMITDVDEVARVLAGRNEHSVLRVAAPADPSRAAHDPALEVPASPPPPPVEMTEGAKPRF